LKNSSGMTAQSFSKPAGILIGLTLLAIVSTIGYSRLAGEQPLNLTPSPIVAKKQLRFLDAADGNVSVIDFASGSEIAVVTGQAGFVRGALRALVRERKLAGEGSDKPFSLVAYKDGRLTLEDTVSAQRIDLGSFGPENAANFAGFLVR
jgi:putative photosynthetic complex assembly protein